MDSYIRRGQLVVRLELIYSHLQMSTSKNWIVELVHLVSDASQLIATQGRDLLPRSPLVNHEIICMIKQYIMEILDHSRK